VSRGAPTNLVDEEGGQGVVVVLGIGVSGDDPEELDVEVLLRELLKDVVHAHRHGEVLRVGAGPCVSERSPRPRHGLSRLDGRTF
jgi:hypothetical protein